MENQTMDSKRKKKKKKKLVTNKCTYFWIIWNEPNAVIMVWNHILVVAYNEGMFPDFVKQHWNNREGPAWLLARFFFITLAQQKITSWMSVRHKLIHITNLILMYLTSKQTLWRLCLTVAPGLVKDKIIYLTGTAWRPKQQEAVIHH